MKQIVVISGKGGTGKTVLTGAFAALAKNKVMVDCDVDAADLHLLLNPTIKEAHLFKSGHTAFLNQEKCIQCLQCINACRFDAIDTNFVIDPMNCEGCAFCHHLCPAHAIELKENVSGEWFISDTKYGPFVHAKLGIAKENSGKLVSLVRQKAKEIAERQNLDLIIIDGSPGIGCPVIACITGADCALVVTEPTLSGLHDAARIIQVAQHFKVPVKMVINKYDLNTDMSYEIERYCYSANIPIIGKIKFDKSVVEAVVNCKTIMETSNSNIKKTVEQIWEKLI